MAVAAGLLLAIGCGGPSERRPVAIAEIDTKPVGLDEFEEFLKANLHEEGLEEPVAPDDADRVRSRLFDDFLDERLLQREAEERQVRVDDAELKAWLGSGEDQGGGPPDPAGEKARREQARRELMVQKVLEAYLRAEARAGGENEGPAVAERRLLRSLREKHRVRVFPERLPFLYRPEDEAPAPKGPR